MAKLMIQDRVVKVYNVPAQFLQKCLDAIKMYLNGEITASPLTNGKASVLRVNREYRVVIDGDKFRVMNHNHYNKYIDR